MMPSRGMGAVNPRKMPTAKRKARRDNTDFDEYKSGGKVAGKWIKEAIQRPGALRAQLGAKEGKPIPAKKLAMAAKKPGKLGQRARLAKTLRGLSK